MIAGKAEEAGLKLAIPPVMNVLAIRVRDLEAVQRALDAKGWKVSTSRNPPAIRVVVMPHITAKRAAEFAHDLVAAQRKPGHS
jgi:tyrosine decarboxylase/aspartate 1-decarboxylase